MPSAGIEPVIPAIKLLQTYDLDRMAISIVSLNNSVKNQGKYDKRNRCNGWATAAMNTNSSTDRRRPLK